MLASYEFTPDTWPMIGAAMAVAIVAARTWRRRALPATVPLAVLAAVTFMWGIASALEVAAVDPAEKLFWHKIERSCQLFAASGTLWFALDYANLAQFLNRWTFAVLAAVPLAFVLLIATNGSHAVIWTGFSLSGNDVRQLFGVGMWMFVDYEMLVGVLAAVVFIWLFARSPQHRRPAALCLVGLLATRLTYVLEAVAAVNPWGAVDLPAVVASGNVVVYALMLLRFRTRQLIPVAYGDVINQMHEGVLVLDSSQRVIEVNPAAAAILGVPAESVRGSFALRMPLFQGHEAWLGGSVAGSREIRRGAGDQARWYLASSSRVHAGKRLQGHLVLLQDITDERRARARVLEQQCAVAALRERAILARELHDNLGQVLGFVKMQAQTARELLARGQPARTDQCLARLATATQNAHVEIRQYIEGAAGTSPTIGPLRTSVAQYVERFRETSGIAVEFHAPEALDGPMLAPAVSAHLFRIVQEALNNVRKHAHARQVVVDLAIRDGSAEAVVRDDGVGFEPAALRAADGGRFGLRFMRERAAEIGGSVGIRSTLGLGTEIVIRVPLRSTES